MDCFAVFELAAALIGVDPSANDSQDLRTRAPALINMSISGIWDLNRAYKLVNFNDSLTSISPIIVVSLNDEFSPDSRFASVCALYLASKLIADENDEMSRRLSDEYFHAAEAVASEISALIENIADVYENK